MAPTDNGPGMRLSADALTQLAPPLRAYLRTSRSPWPEIVEAAEWLRGELGMSRSLWGEACLAMGREQAAVAIAIVPAKDPAHFRSSPGGYFHGMVAKAQAGALNLPRTIWGLRQAGQPGVRGRPGRTRRTGLPADAEGAGPVRRH